MKKQTMKTKLSLNKFKIAKISDFGKSKVIGGNGTDDGVTDTSKKSGVVVNGICLSIR